MKKIYYVFVIMLLLVIGGCYYESYNSLYYALEFDANYSYEIVTDNDSKQLYLYNDGNIKTIIYTETIYSLTYVAKEQYIVKTLNSGKHILVENGTSEFNDLKDKYFVEVHLKELNYKDFVAMGNDYALKQALINNVCEKLFNNTIDLEINDFVIEVFEGKVSKIKCNIMDNGENYGLTINFLSINSTVFEIPIDFEKVTVTEVIPSTTLIKVEKGTSLSKALEGFYVKVLFDDKTEQEFGIEDLEYSCDSYNTNVAATYTVLITVLSNIVTINVEIQGLSYFKPTDIETLQEYADKNKISYGLPSIGNSKALVIPVEFTDYKASPDMKSNLEKAFFGTTADTGWESLSSYYYKSSNGKLNITGTVLDVYNTGNTSSYYNNKYENGADADYLIIKEVLEYYDSQVNYDEYDSNNDGYIDALYIVYTTPVDYDSDTSLWWAFTYEYFTDDYEYYDNVEADYYCFLGYDFLFEETASKKEVLLNTETIIHETGHLLGLDDYYDYDDSKGPSGGIGGGDMMDYNIGDHNPFSKILMGWVTPYVVTGDCSIDLGTFGESGECIILTDEFTSIYDEYYIIDFYSPSGLYELEAGYNGLFSQSGVRIYHVDARLSKDPVDSVIEIFEFDNSYTTHRLISLFQASGSNSINRGKLSTNDDLLKYQKDYTINNWYTKDDVEFVINAVFDSSTVRINITKK